MKNPLKPIDDAVLAGANKAVQAYNWTTGKTKLSLANNLMSLGCIGLSLYTLTSFEDDYYLLGNLIVQPMIFECTHFIQKSIEEVYKKEEKAMKEGYLDMIVENAKERFSFTGYLDFGLGTLCPPIIAWGAGFHTMRADLLPPRKNVFSRGKDKLVEKLKEMKSSPELIPVPVAGREYQEYLEPLYM